jgi:hypothetical protein
VGVYAGDLAMRLVVVLGATLLLSETVLRFRQPLLVCLKEVWIVDLLATVQHHHVMQAEINPYLPASGRQ